MPNFVKDTAETTWADWTDYTHRPKLCNVIYQHVISSNSKKKTFTQVNGIDQENNLITPVTQEPDIIVLQSRFSDISDEIKVAMDITQLIKDINAYSVNTKSSFGSNIGKSSFTYSVSYENVGSLSINFDGYSYGKFGELLSDDHEVNTIHGVILHNHKYYAITNAFMDWLQEPNKPKRHSFLNDLFYQ